MWHSVMTTPQSRRALAIVCALALAWPTGVHEAEAQVIEPSIELRLVTQPISHAPGDRLGIKLAIRNGTAETLDGFRLSVAVFSRVLSRSALHESFDAVSGLSGAIPKDFTDVRVLPGESVTVSLDNPIGSVPLLSQATEGGVYPLQVSLFDAEAPDVPIDSLITPLIYYPTDPETRLNLVLVLPLNDTPSRAPDGVFDSGAEERSPLEVAVAQDGWLTGILDALENRAGANLHLALAPTPRLLEELADMSSGFQRLAGDETEEVPVEAPIPRSAADAIARLKLLLTRRGVQALLVPYAFPDLPSLVESTDSLALAKQVTVAQAVLDEVFGEGAEAATDPRWLFPPAGRLDAATLEQLALTPGADAAQKTFFSETSLTALPEPSGCPGTSPSFTCPVEVTTATGSTVGFPYDAGLRERLADLVRGTEVRLAVQKLFAETAMIREEQPGVAGRVVHATIPSLFHPSPRVSNLMLKGFAQAPWLTTRTPAEGLATSVEPAERQIIATSDPIADQPDESFFSLVDDAALAVARYGELEPPSGRLQRLERNVLVALSRSWWGGQEASPVGAGYAFDSRDEAGSEMGKVTIGGVNEITLTSRQGEIQFPLFNGADYPVTLKVVLVSEKLDVTPSEIEQRFEGSTQQITFEATAQASGTFPVEVSVRTPRSNWPITSKVITIRSTKYNQIALGITIGALAFLILFYVLRALRRRRSSPGATSA